MAYKEKTCPKCGTKHTKRGEFCSRSCGNSRAQSESQKQAISAAKKHWHATSEIAAVVAHNFTSQGLNKVEEPIVPPSKSPIELNQFVSGGDLWTEC